MLRDNKKVRRVLLVSNAHMPEAVQHALVVKDAICVDQILDESELLSGARGLRRKADPSLFDPNARDSFYRPSAPLERPALGTSVPLGMTTPGVSQCCAN